MRRRDFVAGLAGTAAVWPSSARAQPIDRMRHIGLLMSTGADDPETQLRVDALVQGLRQAGWIVGHNVKIDIRWASGETARLRAQASEMLALPPDLIVVGGRAATVVPLVQQAGSSIPIVFVQGLDPVGSGYVASLSRPGGNATGFTQFEYSLSGKWLQLLKEVAPRTVRAAIIRESGPGGVGQWAVIQSVASSMAMEISPVDTRDPAEIERGVAAFAQEPNGGLIVVVSSAATFIAT